MHCILSMVPFHIEEYAELRMYLLSLDIFTSAKIEEITVSELLITYIF